MQPADCRAIRGIDGQVQRGSGCRQPILDRRKQRLDPLTGLGGNEKTRHVSRTARSHVFQIFALIRIETIDLVPDLDDARRSFGIDAELMQHGLDVVLLRLRT